MNIYRQVAKEIVEYCQWQTEEKAIEQIAEVIKNLVTTTGIKQGASEFERELVTLLNRYSMEADSNTPDFVLAQYLVCCLSTFSLAVQQRETWYGRDPRPSMKIIRQDENQ